MPAVLSAMALMVVVAVAAVRIGLAAVEETGKEEVRMAPGVEGRKNAALSLPSTRLAKW
jgi:hypothetical protein